MRVMIVSFIFNILFSAFTMVNALPLGEEMYTNQEISLSPRVCDHCICASCGSVPPCEPLKCLGSVTPTLTLAYMYASNALNSDKDKAHFDYTPIIGNVVGILLNPPEKCLQCKDQFLTIVRDSDIWSKFQSLGSRMCGVAPQVTSHAATCVNIFVNAFNSVAARRPFGRTLSSASLHSDSEMATGPHVENTIAMHHRHPYHAEPDMGLGQQNNVPPRTRQRAATGPSSAVTRW